MVTRLALSRTPPEDTETVELPHENTTMPPVSEREPPILRLSAPPALRR